MDHFDDLLAAACRQPQPQRLLLVFTRAECPPDADPLQRAAFEQGEAGALTPAVCVDKLPAEITSFAVLHEESMQAIPDWRILFVAAMDGRGGHPPNSDEAVQPLRMMVEQIKVGRIARFLAVDRSGHLVSLERG
ncbi:MAG: ribonucleotide reductase subunit alpha [Pseudomonadota bacterium]